MASIKNGQKVVALHGNKPYVGTIARPHELDGSGYVVKFAKHGEHYVNAKNIKVVTAKKTTAEVKAEFTKPLNGELGIKQVGSVPDGQFDKLAEIGEANQKVNAIPMPIVPLKSNAPIVPNKVEDAKTTRQSYLTEFDLDTERTWDAMDVYAQIEMKKHWVTNPELREELRGFIPIRVLETDPVLNGTDEIKGELENQNAARLATGLPQYMKAQAKPRMTKEEEIDAFDALADFKLGMEDDDIEMEEMYYSRRSDIVEANLWVAMMAARKYAWATRTTNRVFALQCDLYQEAVIGVMDAVSEWDSVRGANTRFSSLAYTYACNSVKAMISDGYHLHKLPRNEAVLAGALTRFTDELYMEIGRRPTLDDLWNYVQDKWEYNDGCRHVDKKRLGELWVKPTLTSIDETNEDGTLRWDVEAPEPDMSREELVDTLFATSGLTQEEHDCMRARFHFETDDLEESTGAKLVPFYKVAKMTGISNKVYAQRFTQSGIDKMQANLLRVRQILDGILDMPNDETTKGLIRSSLISNAVRQLQSEPVAETPVDVTLETESLETHYERKHGKKRSKPFTPKKEAKNAAIPQAKDIEAHTPAQAMFFKLFGKDQ